MVDIEPECGATKIDLISASIDIALARGVLLDSIYALECCHYKCEAGLLENNVAWRQLRELAGLAGMDAEP